MVLNLLTMFFITKALAEAGVVLSRLSALKSCSISDKGHSSEQEKFYFYPERYAITVSFFVAFKISFRLKTTSFPLQCLITI